MEDGDFGLNATYEYNTYCTHMWHLANKKPVNPGEDRTLTFLNSFPTENGHFPPQCFCQKVCQTKSAIATIAPTLQN